MNKLPTSLIVIITLLAVLYPPHQINTACAAITLTGDVIPADPKDWSSSTNSFVGNTGYGSLIVDSGWSAPQKLVHML